MKLLNISTALLGYQFHQLFCESAGVVSLGRDPAQSVSALLPRSHTSPKESSIEPRKLERTVASSHYVLNIENRDTEHLCDSV